MGDTPFELVNGVEAPAMLELHEQMKRGEIDIRPILDSYLKLYPRDGALRLLRNLQQLQLNYLNLYEEMKRIPPWEFHPATTALPSAAAGAAETATTSPTVPGGATTTDDTLEGKVEAIRRKFVDLGLVPGDYLPRTKPWEYIRSAKEAMSKLGQGALRLIGEYPSELGRALRLDAGTTLVFQVQAGSPFSVTLGWERTIPPTA